MRWLRIWVASAPLSSPMRRHTHATGCRCLMPPPRHRVSTGGKPVEDLGACSAWLRLRRPRPVLRRFFLTGVPAPIPPGLVAALYASVYPHTSWRFLGCVSNEQVRDLCSCCCSSCD
jgi:hypothetical protein